MEKKIFKPRYSYFSLIFVGIVICVIVYSSITSAENAEFFKKYAPPDLAIPEKNMSTLDIISMISISMIFMITAIGSILELFMPYRIRKVLIDNDTITLIRFFYKPLSAPLNSTIISIGELSIPNQLTIPLNTMTNKDEFKEFISGFIHIPDEQEQNKINAKLGTRILNILVIIFVISSIIFGIIISIWSKVEQDLLDKYIGLKFGETAIFTIWALVFLWMCVLKLIQVISRKAKGKAIK